MPKFLRPVQEDLENGFEFDFFPFKGDLLHYCNIVGIIVSTDPQVYLVVTVQGVLALCDFHYCEFH